MKLYGKARRYDLGFNTPNLSPTPALSYILGVLIGDGSITDSIVIDKKGYRHRAARVRLRVLSEAFALEFKEALEAINLYPSYYRSTTSSKCFSPNKVEHAISVYSVIFVDWFKGLTFRELYECVLEADNGVSFIRGFYESDGYYSIYEYTPKGRKKASKRYVFGLNNTDKAKCELMRDLLSNLGLKSAIYSCKNHTLFYALRNRGYGDFLNFFHLIKPVIKNPLLR